MVIGMRYTWDARRLCDGLCGGQRPPHPCPVSWSKTDHVTKWTMLQNQSRNEKLSSDRKVVESLRFLR